MLLATTGMIEAPVHAVPSPRLQVNEHLLIRANRYFTDAAYWVTKPTTATEYRAKPCKVTPQGLEPQLTEPESVVLPITPRGNVAKPATSGVIANPQFA